MTTQKPKIQGYIEQVTFNCFEAYRKENNLNQSNALGEILASFFGSNQESRQSDRINESWQRISQELRKLQERVARLEITSNLDSNIIEITSNLNGDTLEIISNPNSNTSKITSNLDSDTSKITSEIDSDTLEINRILNSGTSEINHSLASHILEITSNLDSDTLEITSNLDSDTLKTASNLDSDTSKITSEIDSDTLEINSNLDSDTLEITGNLDSDTLEITGNLDSDTLEITGNLDSDTLEIASNLDSDTLEITGNLDSDTLEIAGNLDSDTLEIAGNPLGELITEGLDSPRELSQAELNRFVICEIDQEMGRFTYWMGGKQGFSSSLEVAKRYKSEGMAERVKKGILENPEYERFSSNPNQFHLKYNSLRFFVENSTPKPTNKILAAV